MVHFSYTLYCSQLNYDSALRGINKHTRHSHFTTRIIIMGQKYNTSSTNTTESSNNQGPSREFRKIPFPKETNRTEIKMGLESPVNWVQVSRQPHQWCARSHTYAGVCVASTEADCVIVCNPWKPSWSLTRTSDFSDEEPSLRFDQTVPLESTHADHTWGQSECFQLKTTV